MTPKKKRTNSKSKKWTVNKVSIDDDVGDVGDVCVNQMIIEVVNETEPKIWTKTRTKTKIVTMVRNKRTNKKTYLILTRTSCLYGWWASQAGGGVGLVASGDHERLVLLLDDDLRRLE